MRTPGMQGENLLRELAPQVLAAVVRRYRNFAAAEDAVQEALLRAAKQWPKEGVPDHPLGWLVQVASRRMKDHIRAELARRRRETSAASLLHPDEWIAPAADSWVDTNEEDSLILLFMCCHPALTRTSAIALTLRAVGGLTTAEIANAYLVPETTMAQRISRAKQQIRSSGVPFRMPGQAEYAERLDAVLHILYLIFNEGYASSSGAELIRTDLTNEAIRLTRTVHNLLPEDPEVGGLLALMLLTDARRFARTGPHGEAIPLMEQDRSKWDRHIIAEGTNLLAATLSQGRIGPYQLQAAIAAIHNQAVTAENTDWPQILALYTLLNRIIHNPMVTLSHAIAAAMVHGPSAGFKLLEPLDNDKRMAGHYRLDVARAHLFEMEEDCHSAIKLYRSAAAKANSVPERNYLAKKVADLIRKSTP